MAIDYKIGRCTRRCAVSDRVLAYGEGFVSVLVDEGREVRRIDIAPECWTEAPENAIGWWKAQLVDPGREKPLAPNEVLLQLLEKWRTSAGHKAIRYLLALLLVRRKVLRHDSAELLKTESPANTGPNLLRLYSPHTDAVFEVEEVLPQPHEAEELDAKLIELIHADAA